MAANVASLFLLSALVILSDRWDSKQKVENLYFEGAQIISSDELRSYMSDKVVGQAKENIKLNQIETEIRKNPYVSATKASYKTAEEISVEVAEVEFVAIVIDVDNMLYYLSIDGKPLPYRPASNRRALPIVRGLNPRLKADSAGLYKAAKISETICSGSFDLINKLVAEINYSRKDKTFELLLDSDGIVALVGRAEGIENKLSILEQFWKRYILSGLNTEHIKKIDLRWARQVIVS